MAQDKIGRPLEGPQLCALDPAHRLIVLQLYGGMLKCIPLHPTSGKVDGDAFNVRIDEMRIISLCFAAVPSAGAASSSSGAAVAAAAAGASVTPPVLHVLYEDGHCLRHVKRYDVNLRGKELTAGTVVQAHCERSSSAIVPLPAPAGGVLVISERSIVCVQDKHVKAVAFPSVAARVGAWSAIDTDRYCRGRVGL
jgi:DNA damage-binding protein 1